MKLSSGILLLFLATSGFSAPQPEPSTTPIVLQNGTHGLIKNGRLLLIGPDSKQSAAPPGHYVTRDGRQLSVESNGRLSTAATAPTREVKPFAPDKLDVAPKLTRPPAMAPSPVVSSTVAGNHVVSPKAQREYMAIVEGANVLTGDQLNEAVKVKMNYVSASGWELVTIHNEGGKTVFIYKRGDGDGRWEYMTTVEGANVVTGDQLNEAVKVKMNFVSASGWELATVHDEGGKTVLIYKRRKI